MTTLLERGPEAPVANPDITQATAAIRYLGGTCLGSTELTDGGSSDGTGDRRSAGSGAGGGANEPLPDAPEPPSVPPTPKS